MKVSNTIVYAIQAMLQLARESANVPIPCSQLAQVGNLPKRFLLQILRRLVNHGVLKSTRGADGGYFLSRPADEITLRDIIEAFDAEPEVKLPPLPGFPHAARARVARALADMAEAARKELAKLSLADLIRPASSGARLSNEERRSTRQTSSPHLP
jgi:Rrf2 family protein